MFYIVLTSGYDEPELIGPFADKDAAEAFAAEHFAGIQPCWVLGATAPDEAL